MKRITSVLLVSVLLLVSVFSLSSCEKLTTYGLVSEAIEKTEALDSYEMNMSIDIQVKTMGVTTAVPMKYAVKAAGMKSENPVVSGNMVATILDQKVESAVYMNNSYIYVETMGQKMKIDKNNEMAKEYDLTSSADGLMQLLPEDVLEGVTIVEENDKKTVKLTLTPEVFNEIFNEYSKGMLEGLDILNNVDVEFSDITVSITVLKSGYVGTYELAYKMSYTMDVLGEDYTASASIASKIEFVNPGEKVTVTEPDLTDYSSVTE